VLTEPGLNVHFLFWSKPREPNYKYEHTQPKYVSVPPMEPKTTA